jgi:sigma-E controlled sporulation protein
MIETKNRILEKRKKRRKRCFTKRFVSYKRQLDESDKWIASHFADIDAYHRQTEKALEAQRGQRIV